MATSDFVTFSKLSPQQRLDEIVEHAGLTEAERKILCDPDSLTIEKADKMIDNVIGRYTLPIGTVIGLRVNGVVRTVPMVTEEPSVVLGCSYGGYMAEPKGGFFTTTTGSVMIAQIMLLHVPCPETAKMKILEHEEEIRELCNSIYPVLVRFGGGMVGLDVRTLSSSKGTMVIVHLKVDTRDAMGANAVNTMAEGVSPLIVPLTSPSTINWNISYLASVELFQTNESVPAPSTDVSIQELVLFPIAPLWAWCKPSFAASDHSGCQSAAPPIVQSRLSALTDWASVTMFVSHCQSSATSPSTRNSALAPSPDAGSAFVADQPLHTYCVAPQLITAFTTSTVTIEPYVRSSSPADGIVSQRVSPMLTVCESISKFAMMERTPSIGTDSALPLTSQPLVVPVQPVK